MTRQAIWARPYAAVSCGCAELRYLAAADELWMPLYVAEFGVAGAGAAAGTAGAGGGEGGQGLTLVHFSAQRKHLLRDTLGGSSGAVTQNVSG